MERLEGGGEDGDEEEGDEDAAAAAADDDDDGEDGEDATILAGRHVLTSAQGKRRWRIKTTHARSLSRLTSTSCRANPSKPRGGVRAKFSPRSISRNEHVQDVGERADVTSTVGVYVLQVTSTVGVYVLQVTSTVGVYVLQVTSTVGVYVLQVTSTVGVYVLQVTSTVGVYVLQVTSTVGVYVLQVTSTVGVYVLQVTSTVGVYVLQVTSTVGVYVLQATASPAPSTYRPRSTQSQKHSPKTQENSRPIARNVRCSQFSRLVRYSRLHPGFAALGRITASSANN
ncbi:hypothetical protein RRG08_043993 [Elysia crispata]|uniref:Uncharacterized protein n=1 Tax=Elysia crispata TaxID=231223 RepID=A0AAE1DGE6_9GAST|nr:hypothetical protein RRG08_043993 [Elysia crispata]